MPLLREWFTIMCKHVKITASYLRRRVGECKSVIMRAETRKPLHPNAKSQAACSPAPMTPPMTPPPREAWGPSPDSPAPDESLLKPRRDLPLRPKEKVWNTFLLVTCRHHYKGLQHKRISRIFWGHRPFDYFAKHKASNMHEISLRHFPFKIEFNVPLFLLILGKKIN